MSYFNASDLQLHSPNILERSYSSRSFIKKASVSSITSKDLFLAHSSIDKIDLVPSVLNFFTKEFRASCYVDALDMSLPTITSEKTAEILAKNIIVAKRLVVIVSENSSKSKWVPWELGISHGCKGFAKTAIFPFVPQGSGQSWVEQEYLGLYPKIKKFKDEDKTTWGVFDPRDGKYWTLHEWINEEPS